MAGKILGKVFDMIGLEESTLDEEEYGYDDGYNDGYDEYEDEYYDEPREASRGRRDFYDEDDYEEDEYEEDYYESKPKKSGRWQGGKVRSISKKRDREPAASPEGFDNVRGLSGANNGKMKMVVYQPMTYDDTQSIIDNLKNRKPIIVNLENLEIDIAQRVLDFMSGAVYALNGNIHKVTKGIFMLVPTNVDISGNIPEDMQGTNNFYTLGGNRH